MHSENDQKKYKSSQLHTIKMVDGKFHIKNKQLGKGSFAQTYLAIEINTGAQLACKMISKKNLIEKINSSKNKSGTKDYFITALKNQISTWKNISHQNIVKFKDFSETSNNIYFFLEFCSQGNLQTYLKVKGHIKQSQAIPLLLQISKGCQYLYDAGIFHRDIKTENILITSQGVLKISDFGFAKMINDEETKNNPSEGTSVGTPIYMSPQVLQGQPYTIKCDVWSLGIVFYKVLFNLYPWQKTDNLHTLIQRMNGQILFPPHIEVSQEVKKITRGMLTIDEQKRFSIKKVVEQLSHFSQSMMDVE